MQEKVNQHITTGLYICEQSRMPNIDHSFQDK